MRPDLRLANHQSVCAEVGARACIVEDAGISSAHLLHLKHPKSSSLAQVTIEDGDISSKEWICM